MRYLIAALMCLPLMGLDNSVTILEASGSSQAARPVSIFRTFAQGEFSGTFPKPRIGGSVPSAWQVDVKTAWPDGSVQQAFISFRLDLTANGSAVVDFVRDANPCHLGNLATCQAAALSQSGMLNYEAGGGAGSWSATWYGTVNGIEHSAAARTMLAGGAWRYWMRGPVVTAVIVEDRGSALAYDFGWQYSGGAWGAPTEDKYKSLHPVYELRFYPDPDGEGALSNWPGVEVDAQVWNATILRFQRFDSISLTLKTGNAEATTAYSVTGKSFHARSRRHKLTWSGTAPGAVVVDFNFPYLIHTRIIPSFDYKLAVEATMADTTISTYTSNLAGDEPQWCETSTNRCGNWTKGIGTTGARGDIALVANWYLRYLYLMGHSGATTAKKKEGWDKLVIGNADAGNHAPIYYMEGATNLTYFADQGPENAVGRPISIDARDTYWAAGGGSNPEGLQNPKPYVCEADPCGGTLNNYRGNWGADGDTNYTSHAPSFNAIPYFLTGYHYYLVGTQMEAAFGLATRSPDVGNIGRFRSRGTVYYTLAYRATAWMHRNLALAAILTPDGEIEKGYFKSRLQNNAAFHEGLMLLTTGAHVPANPACPSYVQSTATARTADMWCAGRYLWQARDGSVPASNPTFVSWMPDARSDQGGWIAGHRVGAGYWVSYVANVWAWISRTGAIIDKDSQPMMKHLSDAMAAHYAGRVLSSPTSMYQLNHANWGYGPGTKAFCTTFAECAGTHISSFTLGADLTSNATTMVVNNVSWTDYWYNVLTVSWAKIGDEYVRLSGNPNRNVPATGQSTLTIAQRGAWGSTAAAHSSGATVTWLPAFQDILINELSGGYAHLARSALALQADAKKVGEYSPQTAFQVYSEAMPGQRYESNPQWALMPAERIGNVQAEASAGSAVLRWTAPSAQACRVYFASQAPPSSNDAADPAAEPGTRLQSFSAAGLSPGSYHYRISCGTARAAGTVSVSN